MTTFNIDNEHPEIQKAYWKAQDKLRENMYTPKPIIFDTPVINAKELLNHLITNKITYWESPDHAELDEDIEIILEDYLIEKGLDFEDIYLENTSHGDRICFLIQYSDNV